MAALQGATVILDEGPTVHAVAGDVLLARVPEDIVSLRRSHPELARAWRQAGRDSFGRAVEHGYVATAMTRSGWYVLRRRG